MNYTEKNDACEKAFKDCRIKELHEAREKASVTLVEADSAYLNARDAYYKIYREIWR